MNAYLKIATGLIIMLFASCESMEDTYSEWTEGGDSYHIGKVEELKVATGWKRLKMTWVNSCDPNVANVKVKWTANNKSDSAMVNATDTLYETEPILENFTYSIEVYSVDKNGKHSLKTTQYAKPFSEEHEAVLSFTKLERKSFYIQNNLVLFWNNLSNKEFSKRELSYYSNGEAVTLNLTDEMIAEKYKYIPNVDANMPILVARSANVEGCYDDVDFEPYEIDKNFFNLNGDFAKQIKENHHIENDLTAEFMAQLTEINLDFSLNSLEDILYFPNLEKVILGGQRYFDPLFLTGELSELSDPEASIYAIKLAHDLFGIEVEIYNNHFKILPNIDFAVDKGNPVLPELTFLDHTGWTIEANTEEVEPGENGYSNPEYLLDNDKTTVWEPLSVKDDVRKHELVIDMQEVKKISGFLVSLPLEERYKPYFPESIHVMYSTDEVVWKQAFSYIDVFLGHNIGESRVLRFPKSHQARYVKILVKDVFDSSRSNVNIADFALF